MLLWWPAEPSPCHNALRLAKAWSLVIFAFPLLCVTVFLALSVPFPLRAVRPLIISHFPPMDLKGGRPLRRCDRSRCWEGRVSPIGALYGIIHSTIRATKHAHTHTTGFGRKSSASGVSAAERTERRLRHQGWPAVNESRLTASVVWRQRRQSR